MRIKSLFSKGHKSDILSTDGITPYLDDPSMKDKIVIYDKLHSTNLTAKGLALLGAPSGTVVLANTQTAGRGRLGRSFYSPPDTGIYFSQIIRPTMPADDAVLMTTAVSVAVCRAIEAVTGKQPAIKWVNDIFLDGKKVCGILTEAVRNAENGDIEAVIIGIGINVSTDTFPKELSETAGALGIDATISRNRLAAELINQLEKLPELVVSRSYLPEYKEKSIVLGKRVRILGQERIADVLDIDQDGGLVVRIFPDGEEAVLKSGEISIRLTD